jgi:5'(3')-deoxyribonucleotidase
MKRRLSVLLDCDGVLADFVSAALDVLHDLTGRRYDPSSVTTWEVFDSIPEREAQEVVYQRMKARGGCLRIPIYESAREGVARLRELADVTVVTSPFSGSETWAHEREKWLHQHFGIEHRDVIHAHKKFRVHGDVFIDDKPEHLAAWVDYWVRSGRDRSVSALLWGTPRTTSESPPLPLRQVDRWSQVIDFIIMRSEL